MARVGKQRGSTGPEITHVWPSRTQRNTVRPRACVGARAVAQRRAGHDRVGDAVAVALVEHRTRGAAVDRVAADADGPPVAGRGKRSPSSCSVPAGCAVAGRRATATSRRRRARRRRAGASRGSGGRGRDEAEGEPAAQRRSRGAGGAARRRAGAGRAAPAGSARRAGRGRRAAVRGRRRAKARRPRVPRPPCGAPATGSRRQGRPGPPRPRAADVCAARS